MSAGENLLGVGGDAAADGPLDADRGGAQKCHVQGFDFQRLHPLADHDDPTGSLPVRGFHHDLDPGLAPPLLHAFQLGAFDHDRTESVDGIHRRRSDEGLTDVDDGRFVRAVVEGDVLRGEVAPLLGTLFEAELLDEQQSDRRGQHEVGRSRCEDAGIGTPLELHLGTGGDLQPRRQTDVGEDRLHVAGTELPAVVLFGDRVEAGVDRAARLGDQRLQAGAERLVVDLIEREAVEACRVDVVKLWGGHE